MRHRSNPRPRSTWVSIAVFFALLVLWWGALTLALVALYPDFLFRAWHPFRSGWYHGSWGLVLFYCLLSIPLFPLYNRLDDWLERRRRSQVQAQPPAAAPHEGP